MDITSLAKKPKLAKIEINDEDIVTRYGESISFWMLDEMGIDTYFSFYRLQQEQKAEELNALFRKIILKEDGSPALQAEEILPVDITLAVLVAINDFLGKSKPQASKSETGDTLS